MQTIHEKFPWIKQRGAELRAQRAAAIEQEEFDLFIQEIAGFKPHNAFTRLNEGYYNKRMRVELEKIILQCPYWSFAYAVDILNARWPVAELNIWRTTQEPWRTEYRQKFVAVLEPTKEAGTWEAYCKRFGLDPSKQPTQSDNT